MGKTEMMTDDRTETLTIKKFFHNDPVERYNSYIDSCINEVWGKKEDMVPAKMFRRVFGPAVRLYYSGKRLPPTSACVVKAVNFIVRCLEDLDK